MFMILLGVVAFMVGCDSPNSKVTASAETKLITNCEDGYYDSAVGIWYTAWWAEEGTKYYEHWAEWSRHKPELGFYSSGDRDAVQAHMTFLNDAGINFVIIDDTNGHWNDGGNIAKNIDSIFEIVQEMGEDNTPDLCLAIGGALWAGQSLDAQKKEADLVYEKYASTPVYFTWKGKPLLINYTTVEWFKWKDSRFTVRNAIGAVREGLDEVDPKTGLWGWVFNDQMEESEVRGVMPGWNTAHLGRPTLPISRKDGERYVNMWLEAIKANPEVIVIVGWNDFAEETAIEAASPSGDMVKPWTDHYGNPAPYWYEELTFGYVRLRYGLVDEYYYREETNETIYQYMNGKLITQDRYPEFHPVIVIPDGYFQWFEEKQARANG